MSNRNPRFSRDDYEEHPKTERERGRRGEQQLPDVRESAQEAIRRANERGGRKAPGGLSSLKDRPALLIGAIVAGVAVIAIVAYLLLSQTSPPAQRSQPAPARPAQPAAETGGQPAQPPATDKGDDLISSIFGPEQTSTTQTRPESWLTQSARITLRLALAALLTSILAFRPRKDLPTLQRNPYVAQSQILLAVVASALMMVVGDNAARAFGIFAAASLVRFRTTLRDPKEITVLLVSLGIGLATGVGRWDLAIVLSLFVMLMLWVLEYYEPAQVFRAMELSVTTRNVSETDEILREIFDKRGINAELREIDRENHEEPVGKIVYFVNVNTHLSTDQLSDEIFSSDPENIDSIEWDQKKSASYIYR